MSESIAKSAVWLILLAAALLSETNGNAIREVTPYTGDKLERPVFNYRRNGVKIDVRIVPAANGSSPSSRIGRDDDDGFPQFPLKEIGRCLIDLSLTCIQKRVSRFLDVVGHLREITLIGQGVKLVKLKETPIEKSDEKRTMITPSERIDKSIDNFFDSFALRITLPRWNGNKNQIDVMMDDAEVVEGRGGKGGGGGGKGGGKGGKGGKGGGGCKKMMMMMMMGLKAKMMGMIGMAAMKGMIFSGMSLMITKMMLLQKFMSSKGGMFGGGGGGGGGQLKEIVLLTKGGGGGGGGGGCGGGGCGGGAPPSDSYGAPPPSSYGAPPSGGGGGGGGGGYDYSGGGGGGGGWGRSFDRRPTNFVKDYIFREPQREPAVMMPQEEVEEQVEMKPISEEKWSNESSWNYTTETAIPDQMKASQDTEKKGRSTQSEQLVNANLLRPRVYAKRWKNYELARSSNSDYFPDYDNRD